MNALNRSALKAYSHVKTNAVAEYADSHELVGMLFEGVLDNLCKAAHGFESGDLAIRGEAITKAQNILFGLRSTLDHNQGGEIARLLDSLYDYCIRRLTQAHAQNECEAIQEAKVLIGQISEAWSEMPEVGRFSGQ
tara:strand:+ start:199 stop:606 length:408 start_codon:yes stop_codon:yes gene_type:complete